MAKGDGKQNARAATTPAGRLRRIEAVLCDRDLTRAEAVAVVGVVLRGNGNGLAWPGQRHLRAHFGLGGPSVVEGLRKADGRHIVRQETRAEHGGDRWLVLDTMAESAGNSVPTVGTLDADSARQFGNGSAPVSDGSAPVTDPQRATRRHETEGKPVEPRREPDPAPSAPADSDSNGNADARLVAVYNARRRRPCGKGQAAKFLQAVREARDAGATDALIAHRAMEHAEAAPWAGPNAARDDALELVRDWDRHLEPRRPTVGAILADIDHAKRYVAGETGEVENAGLMRCEDVEAWTKRHAEVLAKGRTWPDVANEPQQQKETAVEDSPLSS